MPTTITVVGNVTDDPELKFVGSGAAVANFTVAVNERVKQADGSFADGDTTFYRVATWRTLAENVAESLTRGTRVIVQGTVKTRTYETTAGAKGMSLEVTADAVGPDLRWASTTVTRSGVDGAAAARPAPASFPAPAAPAPAAAGAWGSSDTTEPPF